MFLKEMFLKERRFGVFMLKRRTVDKFYIRSGCAVLLNSES
jgi:hypothetical protein